MMFKESNFMLQRGTGEDWEMYKGSKNKLTQNQPRGSLARLAIEPPAPVTPRKTTFAR